MLSVFKIQPSLVRSVLQSFKSGQSSYNNQSLPPKLVALQASDLRFSEAVLPYGHCRVVIQRKKVDKKIVESVKLCEAGPNKDHPRYSVSGEKHYIYHLVAANAAYNQ